MPVYLAGSTPMLRLSNSRLLLVMALTLRCHSLCLTPEPSHPEHDSSWQLRLMERVAKDLGLDNPHGIVTASNVAKARANRQVAAKDADQMFNASSNQITATLGTNGLYLTTMWKFGSGGAPTTWLQAFLGRSSD